MIYPLSIQNLKTIRRTPKASVPIRIVPAPKSFALPIAWQETAKQPTSVEIHPRSYASSARHSSQTALNCPGYSSIGYDTIL